MVKKKTKNPPILSHEFVIQNHADILAVVLMALFGGLMMNATKEFTKQFVEYQYAIMPEVAEGETIKSNFGRVPLGFGRGLADLYIIMFQTIVMVIVQAVIQDYFMDKYSKKFHLSKTKHSRFNESGQIIIWLVSSVCYGANIIINKKFFENISSIWEEYPETSMSWEVKAFMISQISYWLHMYPEIYFTKTRKDEMAYRTRYYTLHLVFIAFAYIFYMWKLTVILLTLHYAVEALHHFSRLTSFMEWKDSHQFGFNLWTITYPFTRILTLGAASYVYLVALSNHANQGIDLAKGVFNSTTVRMGSFSAVAILQVWLMLSYVNLHQKKRKEELKLKQAEQAAQKLKAASASSKKNSQGKKDSKKVKSQ